MAEASWKRHERQVARLLKALAQAEGSARATGRLPLLVLVHAPGRGRKVRCYALLPLQDLTSLVDTWGGPT
jgi:hypothetical protein